jgi:hypothetical protein
LFPRKNCSGRIGYRESILDRERSTTMTPEDRDQMIELCKRISRETDPKKLASWIEELNEIIQSKIRELRDKRRAS